ncbi:MAG: OmpH family outer membrane protein [Deltaproteobacteria bacterium]|nr:OmpH family outer membrane protein [Deltaproteobacteria bacterium]
MKHLTKTIVLAVAVLFIQLGLSAAEPVKIGVLDLQRCIQESNEGKRIAESLKNKQAEMQKDLDKKQQELIDMQKDMDKQSLMLSPDAKTEREKEFEKKRRDLNYLVQDLSEEMKKAETEARISILNILSGVVETIAKQQKFDLIAERSNGGILYFSKGLDITDQVLAEFNKVKP